jgi:hypothetical protein
MKSKSEEKNPIGPSQPVLSFGEVRSNLIPGALMEDFDVLAGSEDLTGVL